MKIRMRIQQGLQEEAQKNLEDFFKDVNNDEEFEKRMNQFENMHTPKSEIYQKSKEKFYSVLDAHIQGTLTKEKALLLLQSKYHQLGEEIKDMALKGCFIEIDYEDGKGYIPVEFMKITGEVNYYYNITKNNIGNTDTKLESLSSPAVKRVIESIGTSFDKYFRGEEESEDNVNSDGDQLRQPDKETPALKSNLTLPPVIQDVMNEGLLNDDPVNGKYAKRAGKKDTDIVKWIIDYSGYADSLTTDLYLQYIQTNNLPQTIGQYISRSNTEAKIKIK